jgi:small conductance mechanosensitive channel
MTNQLETVDQIRRILIERGMEFGPRLLVAAIILAAGFYAGRWLAGMLDRALQRFELEPPVRLLLVRLVRLAVLGLFLILALQNLGVQLLPLIAGLGVAGAGIALAMQGVLGNVVAGLTIIFTRPFRVGEYVSMVGEEGQVESIELFTTVLSHPDQSRVVIPNRKIVGEILHNYGKIRQIDVTASVSYDTDLNLALQVVRETLAANPKVLQNPSPVIQVAEMADYCIDIAVKPWVAVTDYIPVPGELNKALYEAFVQRGIQVPFPQHEVRLLNDPAPPT